jgi:crossover junction endodeoxyribonuclease RuvC
VLNVDGCTQIKQVMPTITIQHGKRNVTVIDTAQLQASMLAFEPDHVYIERQQAMPGQGVSSMFSIGYGFGLLSGLLAGMRIPYTVVRAQTWQKEMLKGAGALSGSDTKGASYLVCTRMWPAQDWRANPRCKNYHDGLCDAALIAEYGRRQLAGGK